MQAVSAYKTIRDIGAPISNDSFNNLISFLGGLGEQGSGSYPVREKEPPTDIIWALTAYNDALAANVELYESSYTALIRCCCSNHDREKALSFLRELQEKNVAPRMRTYTPLLQAYSEAINGKVAFQLYEECLVKYNLQLGERDYITMLKLCVTSNDDKFYEVMAQMIEDILVPSIGSWEVFKSWFNSGVRSGCYDFRTCTPSDTGYIAPDGPQLLSIDLTTDHRRCLLRQIDSTILERERSNEVNNTNAPLSADTANAIHDQLHGDAESSTKATAEEPRRVKKSTLASWKSFQSWLVKNYGRNQSLAMEPSLGASSQLEGCSLTELLDDDSLQLFSDKVDVIIDGANIGYYQQNYSGAPKHVDYLQIDAMIRHLQSLNKRILLILHCRHLNRNTVPPPMQAIVDSWRQQDIMYVTPGGCNDDWFWLYAAVLLRCDVVTNDEMRDHHFRMLSPR